MVEKYLRLIFDAISKETYCIIKVPDFSSFKPGSDIDIFCFDPQKIIGVVTKKIACELNDDEIDIHEHDDGKHIHYDILKDKEIYLRLDLYGKLPHYSKTNLKDGYFSTVIENRLSKLVEIDGEKIDLFIPQKDDELILRYIEYIEYYIVRPDKVKHLDYILEQLEKCPSSISYLDKLHYYTDFPECVSPVMFTQENHMDNKEDECSEKCNQMVKKCSLARKAARKVKRVLKAWIIKM